MRYGLVVAALVLGVAWSASAQTTTTTTLPSGNGVCVPTTADGALDARTNLRDLNYLRCHSEVEVNAVIHRLWAHLGVGTIAVTIPTPVAGDDNIPMPWRARVETTLVDAACTCLGTCTTPPTYTFKTLASAAITLASTLTCAVGTSMTPILFSTGDADRIIAANETVVFDTTNTPSGDCTYCVLSVNGAETLP